MDSLTLITFIFYQPFFLERSLHEETTQCESYLPLDSCSKHDLSVLKGKNLNI